VARSDQSPGQEWDVETEMAGLGIGRLFLQSKQIDQKSGETGSL
jgi:hypothetical protein